MLSIIRTLSPSCRIFNKPNTYKMKNLLLFLLFLFCISNLQMNAQAKYTVNFSTNHYTVSENADTINIVATLHPAPTTASGIDLNYDNTPNGDYRPVSPVPTFDFEPGDTVAIRKVVIYNRNGSPHVRVHRFGFINFEHFTMGPDSIFTLTIVDNDSVQDAGIKPISSSESSDIKVFPNPSTGLVNISTPLSGKMKIDLFDMEGRKLKTYYSDDKPGQLSSISLPENTRGIVMLRFETEGSVAYKRLMAE